MTFMTLIAVPYQALLPEMVDDYDQRTSFTAYRMLFSILGGLLAVAIPDIIVGGYPDKHAGFMVMAVLFAVIISIAPLFPFFGCYERVKEVKKQPFPGFKAYLKPIFSNIPFRLAVLIYFFTWSGIALVETMFLYFFTYWLGKADLFLPVVAMLFITAGTMGLAYGFTTGSFKNDEDVMKGMASSMKTLATYLVLVFFAAQFVAYFKWSNLGIILAVKGAGFLMSADIGLIPLMILFILLAAAVNMLMGSASAKWAILAPIFIPMFMIMGYSPELSQVVYRIGDSVTNVISPMMSFFALIIAFVQKYDSKAGIGTIIATMVPYSFVFLVLWILLLIAWLALGLPLGPGAEIYYTLPN